MNKIIDGFDESMEVLREDTSFLILYGICAVIVIGVMAIAIYVSF